MSESTSTSSIAPPTQDVINLDYVDVGLAIPLFILCGYLTWKHGKAGLVCWSILIMAFAGRAIAAIYQITIKDQPMIPSAVSTMAGSAVLACISLGLIGIIYEANTILPCDPKSWTNKIILGATHLSNTAGIGLATYGGTSSATGEGGVVNKSFSQIGNLMMLWVLFAVCAWMWPTWKKVQKFQSYHPNAAPARNLLFAGAVAMPFWLTRIGYETVYAFNHDVTSLDPVMGSFATKLVLLFGTYLLSSTALLAGGWLSKDLIPLAQVQQYLGEDQQYLSRERTGDSSDVEMGIRK